MASDFAPTLLDPVGHRAIELHRLLTDLQVQAFTIYPLRFRGTFYPNHYDGRWATMPSAGFCSITTRVTPNRATISP